MKALEKKIKAARLNVRNFTFGTDEWEEAMEVVRGLCRQLAEITPKEEFCSVDSGEHRTRLLNGKMI
jgi:hypothetical protein